MWGLEIKIIRDLVCWNCIDGVWFYMKNDDGSKGNNYTVYLVMGSLVVFLFILAPISLVYLADINLLIIIMVLGIFLLIGFLIMVLGSFNNNDDDVDVAKNPKEKTEDSKEVKSRNDFSKNVNDVKRRGNSDFNVSFSRSINNQFENIDDEEDERLYSLNMSEEDFYKYRKL